MKKQNFFYRWVILVASFILMAVPFSIINSVHTLFITPVTAKLGFSLSAFSLIFTISAIVIAFISPLVGKLLNVVHIRIVMTVSAVLVGTGFICYSFASNILLFYAIAALIAVGMAGLTMIPISTMITNWFADQRGTALGIAFAGGSTGTFIWMQIVSRIIQNFGYHYAYLILGLIILVVAVPICLFLVHKSPQDKYGLNHNDINVVQTDTSAPTPKEKTNFKTVMQSKAFWPFSMGLLLMGISIAGVQIHVQSYLTTLNYDLTFNANIGSLLAASAFIGSFLGGIIFDKVNTKFALLFFGGGSLLALVALMLANIPHVPYFFAVIFGFCLCLPSLWPSYGVGRIFKGADYSVTLGIVNLFFIIGGACGPFFSGVMADSVLGYQTAWAIYFLLTIAYLFLFVRALKKVE